MGAHHGDGRQVLLREVTEAGERNKRARSSSGHECRENLPESCPLLAAIRRAEGPGAQVRQARRERHEAAQLAERDVHVDPQAVEERGPRHKRLERVEVHGRLVALEGERLKVGGLRRERGHPVHDPLLLLGHVALHHVEHSQAAVVLVSGE